MASFLSKPIPQLSSFAGGSFIGLILGVILLALGSALFPVPFASLIPGMPLLIIGALIVEKFSLLILGIQSINPLRTLYKNVSLLGLVVGMIGVAGLAIRASLIVLEMQRVDQFRYGLERVAFNWGEFLSSLVGPALLGTFGITIFLLAMSWRRQFTFAKIILVWLILFLILPLTVGFVFLLGANGASFSA